MFANRISRYLGAERVSRTRVFEQKSFSACPVALMPAAWAYSLYEAAWAQAKAEVEERSIMHALLESWN